MKKEIVEVIARGICIKSEKILLCQNIKAGNVYLPGGHTEFNETARYSLEREIIEELGVASVAGSFLGMVENSFIQNGEQHCEWNVVFELKIESLDPNDAVKAAEDHICFKWCELADLKNSKLEPAALCDVIEKWMDAGSDSERWLSVGDFEE